MRYMGSRKTLEFRFLENFRGTVPCLRCRDPGLSRNPEIPVQEVSQGMHSVRVAGCFEITEC